MIPIENSQAPIGHEQNPSEAESFWGKHKVKILIGLAVAGTITIVVLAVISAPATFGLHGAAAAALIAFHLSAHKFVIISAVVAPLTVAFPCFSIVRLSAKGVLQTVQANKKVEGNWVESQKNIQVVERNQKSPKGVIQTVQANKKVEGNRVESQKNIQVVERNQKSPKVYFPGRRPKLPQFYIPVAQLADRQMEAAMVAAEIAYAIQDAKTSEEKAQVAIEGLETIQDVLQDDVRWPLYVGFAALEFNEIEKWGNYLCAIPHGKDAPVLYNDIENGQFVVNQSDLEICQSFPMDWFDSEIPISWILVRSLNEIMSVSKGVDSYYRRSCNENLICLAEDLTAFIGQLINSRETVLEALKDDDALRVLIEAQALWIEAEIAASNLRFLAALNSLESRLEPQEILEQHNTDSRETTEERIPTEHILEAWKKLASENPDMQKPPTVDSTVIDSRADEDSI